MAFDPKILKNDNSKKSIFFGAIRQKIHHSPGDLQFPTAKVKNFTAKSPKEVWKLKIENTCKIFRCFGIFHRSFFLLWNYLPIIKKREGSELPPSLLSLANPLESSFLIGRDVTLSFVPIGPKNDVHQKSKAKSPSITGSSELPLKSAMTALEFSTDHFLDQ